MSELLNDIRISLYYDEEESGETAPSSADGNNLHIGIDALYDRDYYNSDSQLNGIGFSLFSEEALTAENLQNEREQRQYLEDRRFFFEQEIEALSLEEQINGELGGATLFGDESFSGNNSGNVKTLSWTFITVIIIVVGMLIGCGASLAYTRFKNRRSVDE